MFYFDTSFLTPLLLEEVASPLVEAFVAKLPAGQLHISQWTEVEFTSLVAREVRMSSLTAKQAHEVLNQFEQLIRESFHVLNPTVADFKLARQFVARFETGLRGGDALHLAIAKNHGAAKLLSLDDGLLKAAALVEVAASRGLT